MRTSSNRALARQLGVSETAVRRAEKAGRIRREADGAWDLARVKAAWARNTDRAQQRRQHGAMKSVPEAALGAVRETYREHALISRQEHEAWDVLLACQGQLRLAPSGHVVGIDMNAPLKIGTARAYDLAVLSELVPAAEAGLIEGIRAGEGGL
jgi:hypothetical protein